MSQADTLLLLDSKNTPWFFGPGWVEVVGDQFVGRSSAWAENNDSTSVSINFTGTAISYLGNTVELVPWNYTSAVDGGTPEYHAMTQGGFDQLAFDWFNVSGLAEGQHTLNLSAITQGAAFDYAAVQPSLSQDIRDQMLIVDDPNPLIKYTGRWAETYGNYTRNNRRPVTPHGGGTHVSTVAGDILQFPFTGTEVHVYGFYDWSTTGDLSISYAIDDLPAQEYVYPLNGTEPHDFIVQANYIYYETATTPGGHVLTLNITKVAGGQRAIIDMIHYRAAFDTLASMPQINIPALTKNVDGPSPSPPPSSPPASSSANVGAIAGGVVGGVVGAIAIIGLIILFLRRRAGRSSDSEGGSEAPRPQSGIVVEPFTLPASFSPVPRTSQDRPKLAGPKQSNTTTNGRESPFSVVTSSGTTAINTDTRVEQLERQVQQLAQETAQLQNTQMPPPYQ